jgi:hypothetical protein
MNNSFTIGYPKLIHPKLIAVLADLQSTVIFTTDGQLIGWIHEASKVITFAEGYTDMYNALYNESELSDKLIIGFYTRAHFKIDGTISHRQWGIKTSFVYPPAPPKPITIDTENNY